MPPSMSTGDIATQRLQKELHDMKTSADFKANRFTIETVDDSLFHMKASIAGPPDTPYADGIFEINLKMTKKYPFSPPQASFITHIWHPNISSLTGCICLDILDNNWAAALTLRGVLLSLQSLLQDPEPDNPLDAVVARQYKNKRNLWWRTASYWTAVYASSDRIKRYDFQDYEEKLSQLKSLLPKMSEDRCISALSSKDWNVSEAYVELT